MEKIEKLIGNLHLETRLTTEDIPKLDLYIDQVIQLFENKYDSTKRSPDDKILTKTMINNYSKDKLFFPLKNKKYSPEHVMLINLIYEMKPILQIGDIKTTLDRLNNRMLAEAIDLEPIYQSFLEMADTNLHRFLEDVKQIAEEATRQTEKLNEEDKVYLKQVLLILSFINMSNYFRRIAESIVDGIVDSDTKKD